MLADTFTKLFFYIAFEIACKNIKIYDVGESW